MGSNGQPPPPRSDDAIAPPEGGVAARPLGVLAQIVVGLAVATALSSGELVAVAEAQPFGPRRSFLVDVANVVDRHATLWRLDGPNDAMRVALGREPHTFRQGQGQGGTEGTSELAAATDLATGSRRTEQGPGSAEGASAGTESSTDRRETVAEPELLGLRRPTPPPGAGAAMPSDPAGPEAVAPGATSPSDAEPARVVDQTSKLRLWAGGDSLGEYVGNQLLHPIADPELVEVTLAYHISTGLTRPDYFDWPGLVHEVMASASPPEVLVFMVGGNDNQNMLADGEVIETGTSGWYLEYERRVLTIVDETAGSHLYWIGLPPMRDETRNQIALGVNEVLRTVADERAGVTFIDLETQFGRPEGDYSAHIVDPDGQLRLARAADGVHITYTGSTWVATDVWSLIEDRWSFEPFSEDEPDQPLPGLPL